MRAACLLALATLLAGCGAEPSDPLFPLQEGRRWEYRVTTTYEDPDLPPREERLELRAEGRAPLGGQPAWLRTSAAGMAYWLRSDATGVYRVASRGPLDPAPRVDSPVRYVLKRPYAPGTGWDGETVPYVLERRNEFPRELRYLDRYRTLAVKYRIEQVDQPVRTAAGDFAGCVVVQGVAEIRLLVDDLFAYRDVPLTTREWYCPGVGLVRQERVEHSPTKFLLGGTVTLELVGWH